MSKRQKCLLLALIIALLLAQPQPVWAEEAEQESLEAQLELLPADEIYELMAQLDAEMSEFLVGGDIQTF